MKKQVTIQTNNIKTVQVVELGKATTLTLGSGTWNWEGLRPRPQYGH